ncbi:MAG: hypothetical protein RLZZ301_889 [Bacteroidota bacterium]|jgi:tRNA (guanosine-2'-O-)-methyltransferase
MTENEFVLEEFYKIITPNKVQLFESIAPERTRHFVLALENIQQDHNASAIMRSMDCLGVQELHLIEKNTNYQFQRDIALGASRWLDVHQHQDGDEPVLAAISELKQKGYRIVATSPHARSQGLEKLDLEQPIAFFFGAEKHGISEALKDNADEFVHIPMYGFTESYNLSVSAALLMQHVRLRLEQSLSDWKLSDEAQLALKIEWCKKILNGGAALDAKYREVYQKEF